MILRMYALSLHYSCLYCKCFVITSSLWVNSRYRSLRAAKPVSSTLNPVKPVSSGLLSPAAVEVQPAGIAESEVLLPAEVERSESRA